VAPGRRPGPHSTRTLLTSNRGPPAPLRPTGKGGWAWPLEGALDLIAPAPSLPPTAGPLPPSAGLVVGGCVRGWGGGGGGGGGPKEPAYNFYPSGASGDYSSHPCPPTCRPVQPCAGGTAVRCSCAARRAAPKQRQPLNHRRPDGRVRGHGLGPGRQETPGCVSGLVERAAWRAAGATLGAGLRGRAPDGR
jgi:hypothetical protein